MPFRELIAKTVGFTLVAAALVGGGILVLYGNHAYNDYLNAILGWGLIGLGLITAGYGAFAIAAILYDARKTEEDEEVHITPRSGSPGPPPPWGMGDIGRPGSGVAQMTRTPQGGGGPRLMSVSVSNMDGVMLVAGLLAWTVLTLVFFAPR
jgi:hypothetical protein